MYDNKKDNAIIRLIIVIIIIIILLHISVTYIGKIEYNDNLTPTGNVDIFDITCNCNSDTNENITKNSSNKSDSTACVSYNDKKNTSSYSNDETGLVVYDKYTIYNKSNLRIFENPAYQYKSIIAPGSSNTYNFIVRNNNNFNLKINIDMKEENKHNLILKYRLKENGNYVLGNSNTWVRASDLSLHDVKLNSKKYNTYSLDWKWEFSVSDEQDEIDTKIGFNAMEKYKLSIIISSNEA